MIATLPSTLSPAPVPSHPPDGIASLLGGAATPPASMAAMPGDFYTPEAFVDTWISPRPRPAPIPRDFTFKAVIGEPDW